jgi:hypothetical protein
VAKKSFIKAVLTAGSRAELGDHIIHLSQSRDDNNLKHFPESVPKTFFATKMSN